MDDAAGLLIGLAEDAEDAAEVVAFRCALLRRVAGYIGADSGALVPAPHPMVRDGDDVNGRVNVDERYYARFVQNKTRYWGQLHRAVGKLVSEGVFIDTEVYDRSDREHLEPYLEALIPAGITSVLCAAVVFQGRVNAILCLNRHTLARPFGGDQAARLRSVLPSLGVVDTAVLARSASRSCAAELGLLSPREREVAALICCGLQNREISSTLGTSAETVRKQTSGIYQKLGVGGRVELVARFGASFEASRDRPRPS